MLRKLFIAPPLAFARLGRSETPADAFLWGADDLTPRGTGMTTLERAPTFDVDTDGGLRLRPGAEVVLADAEGLRPVCPFFELWCEIEADGEVRQKPVTAALLKTLDIELSEVAWSVSVANLKAFHMTRSEGDRIEASASIAGNDWARRSLEGVSRAGAANRLADLTPIALGEVQVIKPSVEPLVLQGVDCGLLRLRFTPPKGFVYGPRDLSDRQAPSARRYQAKEILNPASPWCGWTPPRDGDGRHVDWRSSPQGQYATVASTQSPFPASLGLIDDTSDGIIRCQIARLGLEAFARVVVTPPDYAPDRRPVVSAADGLSDREAASLRSILDLPTDAVDADASDLIADLFERVVETVSLMNLDNENARQKRENERAADSRGVVRSQAPGLPFPAPPARPGQPLPLSDMARATHRRFLALSFLEDLFRQRRGLLKKIRPATDVSPYYDMRMPALMRGSDARPLRLTRAQFALLERWAQELGGEGDGDG